MRPSSSLGLHLQPVSQHHSPRQLTKSHQLLISVCQWGSPHLPQTTPKSLVQLSYQNVEFCLKYQSDKGLKLSLCPIMLCAVFDIKRRKEINFHVTTLKPPWIALDKQLCSSQGFRLSNEILRHCKLMWLSTNASWEDLCTEEKWLEVPVFPLNLRKLLGLNFLIYEMWDLRQTSYKSLLALTLFFNI